MKAPLTLIRTEPGWLSVVSRSISVAPGSAIRKVPPLVLLTLTTSGASAWYVSVGIFHFQVLGAFGWPNVVCSCSGRHQCVVSSHLSGFLGAGHRWFVKPLKPECSDLHCRTHPGERWKRCLSKSQCCAPHCPSQLLALSISSGVQIRGNADSSQRQDCHGDHETDRPLITLFSQTVDTYHVNQPPTFHHKAFQRKSPSDPTAR